MSSRVFHWKKKSIHFTPTCTHIITITCLYVHHPPTGKSTAVKCALSIFGQHKVSHLMKTKGTSESLCLERVQKSTLPFALDDPKSIEEIGEMLIQLCNGNQSGNLRTGLHNPRSIPLLCCNFNMCSVARWVIKLQSIFLAFGGFNTH